MENQTTLKSIAAYCPEKAIWKFMADLSKLLQKKLCRISPDNVAVDGTAFFITDSVPHNIDYDAPEYTDDSAFSESQAVWSIGAIACYLSSGHVIFGGMGGRYQRQSPEAPLPILQKCHERITPIIHKCLCANPKERITLAELENEAKRQFEKVVLRKEIEQKESGTELMFVNTNSDSWPEKMEQ